VERESRRRRDRSVRGPQPALLFALGTGHYALPAAAVAGLAECGPIHEVPGAPPAVRGLAEWRGNVLTVLDLPWLLGQPAGAAPPCLLRMAPPLVRLALFLPAAVQMMHLRARPLEVGEVPARQAFVGRLEHEGRQFRLIDAVLLVRLAETDARERG